MKKTFLSKESLFILLSFGQKWKFTEPGHSHKMVILSMQTKKSLYRLLILSVAERIFSFAAFFRCLAVFNLPADAFIFQLVQLRHEVHDPVERIIVDGIFRPKSFPSGINDACFNENLHVVAQCRLGQGEIGENITGGHFLAGKHINDAETRFVGQRFENGGKFFVTRFVIHKILFSAEIP